MCADRRTEDPLDKDESRRSSLKSGPTLFFNLNKVNDNAGDRLFCPVTFYAKIRF
jgi:hypothetical protein